MMIVTGDNIAGTSHGLDWHTVCYISCTVGYQEGHQWEGHQWVGHQWAGFQWEGYLMNYRC